MLAMGTAPALLRQLALVVAIFASVGLWTSPVSPNSARQVARVVVPGVSVALLWLVVADVRRPSRAPTVDPAPDHLGAAVGHYFECRGFCFAFVPSVDDAGVAWMRVHFQNRYANVCTARVVLQSRRRFMSPLRLPFPGIDVKIECDGGAYGVYSTPWPIPAELQGREFQCEVAGVARYPGGFGPTLRYERGTGVLTPDPKTAIGRIITGGVFLFVAGVNFRHATWQVRLPEGVAKAPEPGTRPTCEVVWRPPTSSVERSR